MVSLLPEKSPYITPAVPNETTPGLRLWSTPHVQHLNDAAHATEKISGPGENTAEGEGAS